MSDKRALIIDDEKMFGKEDAERKEKDTKRRQNDINEQIRRNVEEAMKNQKKEEFRFNF